MAKRDLKLIYYTSENARMSLRKMSELLRKSPQRLKYAISTMKREGIIRDPFCIFDYSYFDLLLFRIYFRGGYTNDEQRRRILSELISNSHIVSIYEFTGDFDLTVEFASQNPTKFNREFKRLTSLIPTLNDYKIVLNLATYICPKDYLLIDKDIQEIVVEKIGMDRRKENFNKNENNVIKQMLTNPTLNLIEISKKCEINSKTAKSIMKTLLKREVVKGFKYVVDTNKIGLYKSRVFLRLHNMNNEIETNFMRYLLSIKEVVQINNTVGDWDMELDIEAFDKNKVKELIMKLREDFKEIVERFNVMDFYYDHKRSYLPMCIFEEE
ncbi:MAG: Lrp/AsnC family transcriptional regulator [Candidatus Aenigmatarchaeota archaeon]